MARVGIDATAGAERVVRFEARAMASPLRLTVVQADVQGADGRGRDPAAVEAAWADVRAEFEAAEVAMSRFRESSDLMRLDRDAGSGRPVSVPRRLERALVAAHRAHRLTGGRFDPRVLRDLDRLGYTGAALETATEADKTDSGPATAGRTDAPILHRVARGQVTIERPIDLGGIGKGLALRWAAARVERHGLHRFLLEAGGDLVGRGPGPDTEPWVVGIEDPGGAETLAAILVETGAVATSSVRLRSWVHQGRTVHHLLDPRTGEPAEGGLRAVTVFGPDPAWAEVWSKTLFIGGHEGIARESRRRGFAAWWVTDAGDLEMTPAARERTAWVAAET